MCAVLLVSHIRLSPVPQIDVEIPVIGHGIGGSNAIGLVFPHTKFASLLHSLNRALDEHAWSFVSQTTALESVWPRLSTNVVVQNLICVQPAFSAEVSSIARSKADMSTAPVTSRITPDWLSMILAVI